VQVGPLFTSLLSITHLVWMEQRKYSWVLNAPALNLLYRTRTRMPSCARITKRPVRRQMSIQKSLYDYTMATKKRRNTQC
jgi:hypothetical protein